MESRLFTISVKEQSYSQQAVSYTHLAYAFAAISKDEPGKIVAFRKDAPLIAGLGKGCNFIASDIPALLKYLDKIYLIENGEMVICTPEKIQIMDQKKNPIKRDVLQVTWSRCV